MKFNEEAMFATCAIAFFACVAVIVWASNNSDAAKAQSDAQVKVEQLKLEQLKLQHPAPTTQP